MKLKELKSRINALPENLDEVGVMFGAEGVDVLYEVEDVTTGKFEGEVPKGCTKDMVLLWNGVKE